MTTFKTRKRNLQRWGKVHSLAMKSLGYERNDCVRFYQVATFVAGFVDAKGSLPRTKDFLDCQPIIESLPKGV